MRLRDFVGISDVCLAYLVTASSYAGVVALCVPLCFMHFVRCSTGLHFRMLDQVRGRVFPPRHALCRS